jgi:hypothetical protein
VDLRPAPRGRPEPHPDLDALDRRDREERRAEARVEPLVGLRVRAEPGRDPGRHDLDHSA